MGFLNFLEMFAFKGKGEREVFNELEFQTCINKQSKWLQLYRIILCRWLGIIHSQNNTL